MKDILMAYFEGLLHQLLEGTEENCETLIGSSQSLGCKIGIWGLKIRSRNGNHHAAMFSTSPPSKSNTIAGYYFCKSFSALW